MGFVRWGYQFEGAYISSDFLEPVAGIYVVWCKSENNWSVLDVAESTDVKESVIAGEKANLWAKKCKGKVHYTVIYAPNLQDAGRKQIEQKLRDLTNLSGPENIEPEIKKNDAPNS